jgi:hypothetical protein
MRVLREGLIVGLLEDSVIGRLLLKGLQLAHRVAPL